MIVVKEIALMKIIAVIIINLSLLSVVNAENTKYYDDIYKEMSSLYCNEQKVLKHLKINNEQCKIYIKKSINKCYVYIEKIPPMLSSNESANRNKDKINKSTRLFMKCLNKEVFKNKNRSGSE